MMTHIVKLSGLGVFAASCAICSCAKDSQPATVDDSTVGAVHRTMEVPTSYVAGGVIVAVASLPDDPEMRQGVLVRRLDDDPDIDLDPEFVALVPKDVEVFGEPGTVINEDFSVGQRFYFRIEELPEKIDRPQIGRINGKPWLFKIAAATPITDAP